MLHRFLTLVGLILLSATPLLAQQSIPLPAMETIVPPDALASVTFPADMDGVDHLALHLVGTFHAGVIRNDQGEDLPCMVGPEFFLQSLDGWASYWSTNIVVEEDGMAFDLHLVLEPHGGLSPLVDLAGQTVMASLGVHVLLIPGWEVIDLPSVDISQAELVLEGVVGVETRSLTGVKSQYR